MISCIGLERHANIIIKATSPLRGHACVQLLRRQIVGTATITGIYGR